MAFVFQMCVCYSLEKKPALASFAGILSLHDRYKVEFIKIIIIPNHLLNLNLNCIPRVWDCLFLIHILLGSHYILTTFGLIIYTKCKILEIIEAFSIGVCLGMLHSFPSHGRSRPQKSVTDTHTRHVAPWSDSGHALRPAQALSFVLWLELPHSCAPWFV